MSPARDVDGYSSREADVRRLGVATQNNKPDLSDLKARLGLKPGAKEEAAAPQGPPAGVTPSAPPPGIGAGGPPSAQRVPGPVSGPISGPAAAAAAAAAAQQQAAQQAAQLAAQQAYAPPVAAPPPAAMRPPAAAMKPKPAPEPAPVVYDAGPEIPLGKDKTFEPKTLALFGIMLAVGLFFGYASSQTLHFRKLSADRQRDALKVHDSLKPPIDTMTNELLPAIAKLDPSKPDYEAAGKLALVEFIPDPGALGGNQILIGSSNVYNITQTMGKAMALRELLKQHNELTNKTDKKELEDLMANNAVLQTNDSFAVIFNYKSIIEALGQTRGDAKAASAGYVPPAGRLVTFARQDISPEGDIKVKFAGSNSESVSPIFGVVVVDKNEMLKSGGQNALARYSRRVQTLKFYAKDLENTSNGLLTGLKQIAEGGEVPGPGAAPADAPAAPAAAPAAPAAPAQ
jgi:hypothetical protein